jgi:hypothetical protein
MALCGVKSKHLVKIPKEMGHGATIGAGCYDSHNDFFLSTRPNFLLILGKIPIDESGIVIAKR